MSKGKNFTAAEKHFEKKESKYRKQLKEYENKYDNQANLILNTQKEMDLLISKNTELKEIIKKYEELQGLCVEEVREKIKLDKTKQYLLDDLSNSPLFNQILNSKYITNGHK